MLCQLVVAKCGVPHLVSNLHIYYTCTIHMLCPIVFTKISFMSCLSLTLVTFNCKISSVFTFTSSKTSPSCHYYMQPIEHLFFCHPPCVHYHDASQNHLL